MRQVQKDGQAVVLAATEEFHIRPAVGTANHRQDGRDLDVVQRMQPGPFQAGIFDVVKEVRQGDGGAGDGGHEGELRVDGDESYAYVHLPNS